MDRHFKIKITDENTGKSDTLTLDLRRPVDIQLSVGVFGKVIMKPPGTEDNSVSYLLFIASAERDYGAKTLHNIVKAAGLVFGGSLIWELSPDRPPKERRKDIQAYLYLNTKRYDKAR